MRSLQKPLYWFRAWRTLLVGVQNWPALLGLLSGHATAHPLALNLRDGSRYAVDNAERLWTIKRTSLDRAYERYGAPIEDGWNVVDLDAGLGDFTIFAARRTPHGRVYAYESDPAAIGLLRLNLKLNDIANVTTFPYTLAAGLEGSRQRSVTGGLAAMAQPPQVEAPATTTAHRVSLIDVLSDLPGGACDFLKMDCTGAGYDGLMSSDQHALRQIKRICLTYRDGPPPRTHADLAAFLEADGWQIRLYPDAIHSTSGYLYAERTPLRPGQQP